MKRYLDQIPRWQPLAVPLSGVIKRRVWSGDDSAGTERECWKLASDQRCSVRVCVCVCVLVCGACLASGWSWRLKPVGIREIQMQMPSVNVYMSVCGGTKHECLKAAMCRFNDLTAAAGRAAVCIFSSRTLMFRGIFHLLWAFNESLPITTCRQRKDKEAECSGTHWATVSD